MGDLSPIPVKAFWPELDARWQRARQAFKETVQAIGDVGNLIDARFQDLYRLHYKAWIRQSDAPMVFTHQFLSRMVGAHWDPSSGRKAVVMVFDGLRTDAWNEFLRPVFEERFRAIESRPGSALIPTETYLSRKAISAGCRPEAFTATRELNLLKSWLKSHLGQSPHFEVVHDDDTVASGMAVRYVSEQFEYIVFNFTDRNLHGNPQDLAFIYDTTVREIIHQDVRSVLRELPDDVLIFVTSDHGFAPVPKQEVKIPSKIVADRRDVKYRYVLTTDHLEGVHSQDAIEFDAHVLGIPTHSETVKDVPVHYALFPRPGHAFRRPQGPHRPDRYTHGGLSLAECMVPMVVLGPQEEGQPLLRIESARQVGSVSEGEELEIEILVATTQAVVPDLSITLSFSRDEIPTRREVYRGIRGAYTVRWQPQLDDLTDEDRQQREIVLPVTVILTYRQRGETVRLSRAADVRVKLDPPRRLQAGPADGDSAQGIKELTARNPKGKKGAGVCKSTFL